MYFWRRIMNALKNIIILVTFILSISANAVEVKKLRSPEALQEGLKRTLPKSHLLLIKQWAKNTKLTLEQLVEDSESLSKPMQISFLARGIKDTVLKSAPKQTELLMRFVLNRGLEVYKVISKESDTDEIGVHDLLLRVLHRSIDMAIEYYQDDYRTLNNKKHKPISFAKFGIRYLNFMTEINKSNFDASSQYIIARYTLEWFIWDLYRDQMVQAFAPTINSVSMRIKNLPPLEKKLSGRDYLRMIRRLKKIIQKSLNVAEGHFKNIEEQAINAKRKKQGKINEFVLPQGAYNEDQINQIVNKCDLGLSHSNNKAHDLSKCIKLTRQYKSLYGIESCSDSFDNENTYHFFRCLEYIGTNQIPNQIIAQCNAALRNEHGGAMINCLNHAVSLLSKIKPRLVQSIINSCDNAVNDDSPKAFNVCLKTVYDFSVSPELMNGCIGAISTDNASTLNLSGKNELHSCMVHAQKNNVLVSAVKGCSDALPNDAAKALNACVRTAGEHSVTLDRIYACNRAINDDVSADLNHSGNSGLTKCMVFTQTRNIPASIIHSCDSASDDSKPHELLTCLQNTGL
jgi:hypothetical protein